MNTNKVDWASEVQSAVLAMKEEGQKAYTFMKAEAPEVAREYIAWQVVRGFTLSIPLLLASTVAVAISVKAYRTWCKERIEIEKSWERGDWGVGCVFALVAACGMTIHRSRTGGSGNGTSSRGYGRGA